MRLVQDEYVILYIRARKNILFVVKNEESFLLNWSSYKLLPSLSPPHPSMNNDYRVYINAKNKFSTNLWNISKITTWKSVSPIEQACVYLSNVFFWGGAQIEEKKSIAEGNQITTNIGALARPNWRSRNNAHIWPDLPRDN